jgi:hypothetical protein
MGAGHLVVVADADGMLLSIRGDVHVRSRAADSMNFAEGSLWSESGAGTNAIGTAVATGHAVQVFAAEHFNEPVQRWTCAAAPVREPEDGQVIGVVDLTGDFSTVHAHSLAVVVATAQAIENFLRLRMHDHDQLLCARHAARLDPDATQRALVSRSGRLLLGHPEHWSAESRLRLPAGGGELVLPSGLRALAEPTPDGEAVIVSRLDAPAPARPRPRLELELLGTDQPSARLNGHRLDLRRRHAELLVLLHARPKGADAEELSLELYGDSGNPASVRVEMSRLRKQLPGCLHPERYALAADVDSDADHVERALRSGSTRLAAELYPGPILPRAEAPGVVRVRDELEGWLRNAVLTSDDAEALWHWTRSAPGADDLLACSRLLGALAYDDVRRSEVAAHVARLRADRK